MKLSKTQKDTLLELIAAGLETDEINKRAAKFKPPFKVSRQLVRHYRKSRDVKFEEIKNADEASALKAGLSIREKRVAELQAIADELRADLFKRRGFWLSQSKTVANEKYDYEEFNKGQVVELRGILDDIAREVGERRPDVLVNNTFNFDMEAWKKERSKRLKAVEALETK